MAANPRRGQGIAIGEGLANVAAETQGFYKQIGVEQVGIPARYGTQARARRGGFARL